MHSLIRCLVVIYAFYHLLFTRNKPYKHRQPKALYYISNRASKIYKAFKTLYYYYLFFFYLTLRHCCWPSFL